MNASHRAGAGNAGGNATGYIVAAGEAVRESIVSSPDFIEVVDDAMPSALCDELIAIFSAHPGVSAGVTSAGEEFPHKKLSQDLTLNRFDDLNDIRREIEELTTDHLARYFERFPFVGSVNPVLRNVQTGESVEITMDNVDVLDTGTIRMLVTRLFRMGSINIQRYEAGVGGYPMWHSEIYPDETFEGLHRMLFWMYYLNDVESGGETEFYFQKLGIRPRKGTLVVAPAGFTHTHRGAVPQSNDKYIVTSWLLYNRAS